MNVYLLRHAIRYLGLILKEKISPYPVLHASQLHHRCQVFETTILLTSLGYPSSDIIGRLLHLLDKCLGLGYSL